MILCALIGGQVSVTLDDGEAFAGFVGPLVLIPVEPGSPGMLALSALIAKGTYVQPALEPPSPPPPPVVSAFQAKAVLQARGHLDGVDAYVAFLDDPILTLAWREARDFERASPSIARVAVAMNMTDAEVDELFREADKIKA